MRVIDSSGLIQTGRNTNCHFGPLQQMATFARRQTDVYLPEAVTTMPSSSSRATSRCARRASRVEVPMKRWERIQADVKTR
jgi:hypothetical protein